MIETKVMLEEAIVPNTEVVKESILEIEEPAEVVAEVSPKVAEVPIVEAIEEPVVDKPLRAQQKAVQGFDINMPEQLLTGDQVVLPANFDKETRIILEKTPNINLLDDPKSRDWGATVANGLEMNTFNEAFVPTLEDQEANFTNNVAVNGISLNAKAPTFKASANNIISGERAVLTAINQLGLGTLFQAPMWHSGIWVTFKPPSEAVLIEVNRLFMSNKIRFGRETYGLVFSNTSSYTIDLLMDMAISHIYDLSTKHEDINAGNIRDHLSAQDIPSFLWGFVCSMYPRGFRYRRACIADPEKCNHILEETLNVSKLQWVNTAGLTPWQKTYMSERRAKQKDIASVNRYKEELASIQKKRVEVITSNNSGIFITIKSPNINGYVDAGHRWIGTIVETVEKTLGTDAKESERNAIIVSHGQASALKQYSHWIESIEIGNNIINDQETVESVLEALSADDELRPAIIQHVIDFINMSSIAVIGVPAFDCPKCGTPQETSTINIPSFKNIIPLDVIQLFFGLLTQRLSRLTDR